MGTIHTSKRQPSNRRSNRNGNKTIKRILKRILFFIEKKKNNGNFKLYLLVYHGKKKGENMPHRSGTKASTDKKIFHVTASTTKKINVAPKTMRGGIRL